MASVGTLAWARETGGRLRLRDRLALARAAAGLLLANLPALVTYRLGLRRRFPAPTEFEALRPPDTKAATAAETLLTELAPPFMVNHSLRTYWFSRLLGLVAGRHADDEALYVASLLHDVGFYGRYAGGGVLFDPQRARGVRYPWGLWLGYAAARSRRRGDHPARQR
jgi:hypothetical protein